MRAAVARSRRRTKAAESSTAVVPTPNVPSTATKGLPATGPAGSPCPPVPFSIPGMLGSIVAVGALPGMSIPGMLGSIVDVGVDPPWARTPAMKAARLPCVAADASCCDARPSNAKTAMVAAVTCIDATLMRRLLPRSLGWDLVAVGLRLPTVLANRTIQPSWRQRRVRPAFAAFAFSPTVAAAPWVFPGDFHEGFVK